MKYLCISLSYKLLVFVEEWGINPFNLKNMFINWLCIIEMRLYIFPPIMVMFKTRSQTVNLEFITEIDCILWWEIAAITSSSYFLLQWGNFNSTVGLQGGSPCSSVASVSCRVTEQKKNWHRQPPSRVHQTELKDHNIVDLSVFWTISPWLKGILHIRCICDAAVQEISNNENLIKNQT